MKKILCLIMMLGFGLTSSYAQADMRVGVNAGLPLGDAADLSKLAVGADIAYLVGLGSIFQLGPTIGYNYFVGDEQIMYGGPPVKIEDFSFVPIGGTARLGILGLELGADMGYALGLKEGIEGGLYYKPKVGFSLFGIALMGSYTRIKGDEANISSINLGIELRL